VTDANDLLAVDTIDAFYGANHILRNVALCVGRGEAISLLGRNGMGKTTLLRSLAGLVRPRHGTIRFDGRDCVGCTPADIARRGMVLVPDGRGIFRNLTVEENLQLPLGRRGLKRPLSLDEIYAMFPRLHERRRHWGDELSGGEQQMLAIGRALLMQPRLLMIDEATEGLAPKVRDDIWRTLRHIADSGVALIVVDKNIDDLLDLCRRHMILVKGEVVFSGDSAALRADPAIIHEHLGL
jgi:branched-chain amino acid transport system ATP-binding protein